MDELENVNHGVLCDALVEVSGTQILFCWIGLKQLAHKHVKHSLVFALTPGIPGGGGGIQPPPLPILYENRPTRIGLKNGLSV